MSDTKEVQQLCTISTPPSITGVTTLVDKGYTRDGNTKQTKKESPMKEIKDLRIHKDKIWINKKKLIMLSQTDQLTHICACTSLTKKATLHE